MNELHHFQNIKHGLDEEKKESRAALTVEWYKKIGEMLENPCYSSSEDFLQSVLEFIEEKEFITDKQIEICDRIFRHPNWD